MSRNRKNGDECEFYTVTSREGRVSRNLNAQLQIKRDLVTSREGRVSRNIRASERNMFVFRHVPRGTCE